MKAYLPPRWTGLTWISGGFSVAYAASVQKDSVAVSICCVASACLFAAGLLNIAYGPTPADDDAAKED